MVRSLALVLSLGSALLCAPAGESQSQVCTRYENGQLYVLPGCRGPGDPGDPGDGGGRPGERIHPFTGEAWASEMAILSWNQMMALVALTGDPDPPAMAEGSCAVSFMASFSQPTASGARIAKIRITTKDLIEQFKREFGASGKRASLVSRREIEDLEGDDAQLYFVMDGVYHLVESFIEPLPLSLPEGFYGSASAHTLRPGDDAPSSLQFHKVSAMAIGDLDVDGFSMGLFSLDEGKCALKEAPGGEGFLCKRLTSRVTGGMQLSDLPLDSPLLVTGTLQIGPERLVSP